MKRTKHTLEFKLRVVRKAIEVGQYSQVARQHELHPSVVGKWVRSYRKDGESVFYRDRSKGSNHLPHSQSPELSELENENELLKKIVGEKDLEIAILKDLLKKGSQR